MCIRDREETVARNCLLEGSVDLVLAIADATNLERNLYLTTQLLEWDYPIAVSYTHLDVYKRQDQYSTKTIKHFQGGIDEPCGNQQAVDNTVSLQ